MFMKRKLGVKMKTGRLINRQTDRQVQLLETHGSSDSTGESLRTGNYGPGWCGAYGHGELELYVVSIRLGSLEKKKG